MKFTDISNPSTTVGFVVDIATKGAIFAELGLNISNRITLNKISKPSKNVTNEIQNVNKRLDEGFTLVCNALGVPIMTPQPQPVSPQPQAPQPQIMGYDQNGQPVYGFPQVPQVPQAAPAQPQPVAPAQPQQPAPVVPPQYYIPAQGQPGQSL